MREMFSGYKDAPSYYNNQSLFENRNQGSFLPADTSKQTSAPPWDYTQQSFNAVPCYTGDQNLNHRHSDVIHNQVVSQFDNNNVLAHYKNISSGNNHQSVVRPRAVINCQSNCNACYNHSVGRIPSHWNPPTENVHYVPGSSAATVPTDNVTRFAPNLASFPQHEDSSHHITGGFATHLNKLSRFSKETVPTSAPKKDVLSPTGDCSVLRNHLPRAEPPPNDSATVKKDTCVACRGVCNRTTCKIYQHQSIKFPSLEPIALQQYGVPRENVVRYTGQSNGNSNCNQWPPVGTHQPPGLWLQNSRPPGFWMPPTENIRNVGNTNITNFWSESGCDTSNQQLPPHTSYHEGNTDKPAGPIRNQSQKETDEYQEPPQYTELLVRRKMPDEMRYQPHSTLADCGIPQDMQYRSQVDIQSNKDIPQDSSSVSESTRSHASLNGVNSVLPNFPPSDLSNQSRYHKPKVPPTSSSSNFSPVLGIAQPPLRFSSDPTYTQSKISRSNNYMRLFPEHTIEDTYNLSSDIVGNSFSSFSRSGTTNRHLPYHGIKHPSNSRNAESIIRFGGESSANVSSTHLQPCGRMPSDSAQYQGISSMQVVESNPSCSMSVSTYINSPPNRRETGYQNMMSSGGDCNMYYNRQTLHPLSYDDDNYNIHTKIGVISRSSKETCHLTPPSVYMTADKPHLLPLLDESGVNRPIKKRKPRTKMRPEQERWQSDRNSHEMSAPVLDVRQFLATWDEETDDLSPGGQKLPDVVLSNSSVENPLLVLDCRTINTNGVATLSTVDRNSLSDGNEPENVIHMYQHEISPSSCNSSNNDIIKSDVDPVVTEDLSARPPRECPSLIPIEPENVDTCIKPLPAMNLLESYRVQENTRSCSIEEDSIKSMYKSSDNNEISRNSSDPPLQKCQNPHENGKDSTSSKIEISKLQECQNLPDNLHLETSPCPEDSDSSDPNADGEANEYLSSETCRTDKSNLNNTVRELPLLIQDDTICVPTLRSLCTAVLKQNGDLCNEVEKPATLLPSSECMNVPVKPKLDSDTTLNAKNVSENSFEISRHHFKVLDLSEESENNLDFPVTNNERNTVETIENNKIIPLACDKSLENESFKLDEEMKEVQKKHDFNTCSQISPKAVENKSASTTLNSEFITLPDSPSVKDCVQELIKNIDEISKNESVKIDDNLNPSELTAISDSFEIQGNENINSDTSKEESFYLKNVGDVGEDLDMSVTSSIPSTPGSDFQESEDEMLNMQLKVSDSDGESRVDIAVNPQHSDCNELTLSPEAVMLKESVDVTADPHSKHFSDDFDKLSNSGDIFANLVEENTDCNDKSVLHNCPLNMSVNKTHETNVNSLGTLEVHKLPSCTSGIHNTISTDVYENEAQVPDQMISNAISKNCDKIGERKQLNVTDITELDEINPFENVEDIAQYKEKICVQLDSVSQHSSMTVHEATCEENTNVHPNSDLELPSMTERKCQLDSGSELPSKTMHITEDKENSFDQLASKFFSRSEIDTGISENINKITDGPPNVVKDTSNAEKNEVIESNNCDNIFSDKSPNSAHSESQLVASTNRISAEIMPNSDSDQQENAFKSSNVKSIPDHKIHNLEHSKDKIMEVFKSTSSLKYDGDEETKSCEGIAAVSDNKEEFEEERFLCSNPETASENENVDALDLVMRTSACCNDCESEESETKDISLEARKNTKIQNLDDTKKLGRKEASHSTPSTSSCNKKEEIFIKNVSSDLAKINNDSDINIIKANVENLDMHVLKQAQTENNHANRRAEKFRKNEVKVDELCDKNNIHDCEMPSALHGTSSHTESNLTDHNKSSMESVASIGESNEERNDSLLKENEQNEEKSVLQEIIGTCLIPSDTDSVANKSLENLNVSKQLELYGNVRDDHQEETDNREKHCDIGGRVTKFTDVNAMSVDKVIKEKELQCKAVARSSLQEAPKTYSAVQNMTRKSSSDDIAFPLSDILENTEYLHCSQPLHLCSNEYMNCGSSDNSSFKQTHLEDELDAQGSLEISKEEKTLTMSEADIDTKAESNLVRNETDQIGCLKITESLVSDSSCRYETDETSQNSESGLGSTDIVEGAKFTETFSTAIESVPCTANSSSMIKTDGSLGSEFQAFKQECSKEEKRIETILEPAQSVISRKTPLITTDESSEAESNILGQKDLKDNESHSKTSEHVEKKMKTSCSVVQREGDEDVSSVRLCPEANISEEKESEEKEETDEFRKEVTSFYYDSVTVPSRIFEIDEELDYDYDDCDDEEEEEEEEEEQDDSEEEEETKMQAQEEEETKQEESEPQQKKDEILQESHESFYKNVNSCQLEADKLSETLKGKELECREVVSDEGESVVHCGTGIGKQKECISIEKNSNIKSLTLDLSYARLGEIEKENNENEVEDEDERVQQEGRQRTQEFVGIIDSCRSEEPNASSGVVGENERVCVREKAECKSVTEDSNISKSIQPEATEMSSEVKVNGDDEVEEKQEPSKDLNVIKSCTETVNPSSVEERKDDKLEGSGCLYTEVTDAISDFLKDINEETKGKQEEEVEKENICGISFINPVQSEVVDISSGVSQEQEKHDDKCNGETDMEKEEDEEEDEEIERIQIYSEDNTIAESQVVDLSALPLLPENRMEVSEEDADTVEETSESMKSLNSINSYCNESMIIKSSDDLLCSDIVSEVKPRNFESTASSCLPKNKNALNKSESNSIIALQDFGKETNDSSKSFSLPSNEIQTYRESAKTLEDDSCKFLATEILEECVLPKDNIREVTKNNLVPALVNSLLQNDHVSHDSENSSCSSVDNSSCDVIIDFDKSKDSSYKQKSKEYQLLESDNEPDNQRSAQICKIDKNKSKRVFMEEETVKDNGTIKMDEIEETQNKDTIKSKGLKVHDDDSGADSLSLKDEDILEYQDISSANKKIKNNYPKKPSESMQNIEHDLNYNLLQDEKLSHNRKLAKSIISQNVSNNEENILCNPTEKDFLQQDVNQLAAKYDTEKTNLNISPLEKQDFSCDEIDRGSFHFEDVDNDCSNISFEKLSSKDNDKHRDMDANVTVEDESSTPAATSECDLQFQEYDIEVENSEGNISVSNSSEAHVLIKSNEINEHEKCLENVDCHTSEEEYGTVKGTGAVENDISKSYLPCNSESSKIQTSIDMDDMPHLEIINTEISPDDSDSLEMPCLELFTDTIKVTEHGPELSPEIASPTSTKETREKGNLDIKKDNADTNLIIMAKDALMNTVKTPDPVLSHKEKNSCTKIILKQEIPDKLSPVEKVPLSKCPNKNFEQYNSDEKTKGVLLQHDSSVLMEIEKEQFSLSNNKEMLEEDVQNDSVSLSNNKEILTEDVQNDSLPNNKKILAEDLQDDMEHSHMKENKIKANLQDLPVSPNTLRVLSSYLESDTTTLQVVEVSADELQEEWESLQLATSDLVNVTAVDDKTQDLDVLMSTVENSDTLVSAENVAFQTKLANSQDKTPVCLSESDNSISKESEKLDLLTSEVVSFQSLAVTYRVSNSNLDDIIPTESVSNWPYLEEEVFSDLPVTNTNSVDIPCAASLIVSPQSSVSEEPSPSSSNDIATNSSQINLTQCESSLAINELKCRLSWKRIFNLSKANRRKRHQTNSVHIDASNDKAHIDSRNSELFSSDLETSDETVLNEDTNNKSEILNGIVKNKQKRHGLRKKQIELGLAKIEVRLTPTPPLKGVGLQKKWEVVDDPKFEKTQKNFTDSISIDNVDPSSGTINPVPIVLVKKLILKRRSSDESEGDSEVKRPNISSNLELSPKLDDIPNNPDNIDNIQSATEISNLDEDVSNDSKSQINSNRSSECEEDASSVTSAVSTASSRSSSRSESKYRSRSRSKSQSSSSTMESSRSRTSSRSDSGTRSLSFTRSITRSRSRSRTRSYSREKSRTRSNSREKSRTRSNSREESRTRSNSREENRTRSNSREKSRTRSNSREKSRTRSNSREESRTRSNSREESRTRSNSREKSRIRSNSREESRTRSNSREKSRTRSNSREKSRTRSNSREESRTTRSNSREESRTRSNSREKSRTRSNSREKSRTRSNSREESRTTRSNSREESRTRSNSREESRTRSNSREKSRTRSNSREESRTRHSSRTRSRTRSTSKNSMSSGRESNGRTRSELTIRKIRSRTRSSSGSSSRTRSGGSSSIIENRYRSNSITRSRTRSRSNTVENKIRDNSRIRNRTTRSRSRSNVIMRSGNRMESRSRSNSSTRSTLRRTNKMGSRSRTRSSNRGRTKSGSGTEGRTRSNSRTGIRTRSNSETASRNISRSNSFDSTKSRLSEIDSCKTQSESNEQSNINSHLEPPKISVDEVTDKFRCDCIQLCICPKVVDDINLSEDRLLPRVIIKRTSGMGNTNNYRSFLRSASLSNTDSQWQPVVRLERSSSLDELAKKISIRNGSYKDGLSHGLKITLKSPTCQPCVQLVPLPFNRIRRHSESESEASRKQRRRKYFSRINAHRSAVNRWRTRRCNKLVHTSDSVSISSDTNDTEPNSEPSLSIKLTTFNSFTKVQNETRQTDKNKSHIITNLKNSEDCTHKVLENDENDEYRVVENKNYTKENVTKITFQRHKKKEKVLSRSEPKVINVKIKEYKQESVQNQSSQQGTQEDEATQCVASSTKENSMKITFQLHKKKETSPKMIDLKMKDYKLDLAHDESNQETIQEDKTIQKVTCCNKENATEITFQQNKKKEEVLNENEPGIIDLKIEVCKQDKSKQQIAQENETTQVESSNKENSTKITLKDHTKKEEVLNGTKPKISIKIKENKQVLIHNDSNQQSVYKNETTEKVASSSSEMNNKRLLSELDHGKVEELHLKKKQHLAGIDGNEVPQASPERVTIDIPIAELHVTSDISDHSGIKRKRTIDDAYKESDELPFFQPDRILSISSIKKKRTCIDKINPELDSSMPKDKCESLNEIEISKKVNVCDKISTTTIEEMSKKDQPSESHAVSVQHDRVCQACGHIYEDQNERALHVRQHPYHCQRCHLAFQSECDFVGHLSEQHPCTRERHHCLLCERTFPTADRHRLHLASRTHRHLELTQRRTIHTLYSIFTGQNCPVLPPLTETELAGLNWFPVEPGTIHFYHQATPLQRAVQDLITKKKGDCMNAAPVTSRRSAEDTSSTS